MRIILSWFVDNKDWLFNGVGALLFIFILTWIARIFFKKRAVSSSQVIHSGDSSTNIQAGRDVNVEMKKKGNYVGKD